MITTKKFSVFLTFLILVGLLCIPAVSAETIIDEEITEYEYTGGTRSFETSHATSTAPISKIYFKSIQNHPELYYVIIDVEGGATALDDTPVTYTLNGQTHTAHRYISHYRNYAGVITLSRVAVYFDEDWDIGDLTGTHYIQFSSPLFTGKGHPNSGPTAQSNLAWVAEQGPGGAQTNLYRYDITVSSVKPWYNHLTIKEDISDLYHLHLKRDYGTVYPSQIDLYNGPDLQFSNAANTDFEYRFPRSSVNQITLNSGVNLYNWTIGTSVIDPDPDETSVTVYVRNTQTGALIANAQINISASVNGNLHEVVNETVPSGIYSIDLQPTGGGIPNPDFYRLVTTAEGYNSVMPYMDFEVDGATSIYAYLDPIGGAPEDENNTFIDFYVRDMSANPISGATVNFGGYTLITNSAGYTIFEVDKSKTYSWTVSKSGYGSLTGNAVIGGNARHTINTVLAPAVTPTIPTAIPTSTPISPTPTMTAPTGEPTSNWLEWFAAHFGMILGGGVEIGKIFMWLCFAVPVGVYVGKEAKAGAAGFMAGAGVVTLFFVLIGWVPIWLLVFIALIIGLLYAKVFNNSDNGGGR